MLVTRDTSRRAARVHQRLPASRRRAHRGLREPASIQCHYHAWTYDLDGSLRSAPRSEREPDFDPADWSLLPASVGTWGPFLFVNPDPEAQPLTEHLGDLPEILARDIDLDGLTFHSRVDFGSNANWKIVVENFLECYHCPTAHPSFSAEVDVHPGSLPARGASDLRGAVRDAKRTGERGQFHLLFPEHRYQRLPRPPEPLDRADRAERHRPDGALPRLLLRTRRRPGVARGVLRIRRPGRPRGHGARRVGAPWDGVRHARARPPASERRAAARRVPVVGDRVDTLTFPHLQER